MKKQRPPQNPPRWGLLEATRLALLTVAVLLPLVAGKLQDWSTALVALLLLLTVAVTRLAALGRRGRPDGADRALAALLLWSAVSCAWAPYFHGAALATLLLLCSALAFWLGRELLGEPRWARALLILLVALGALVGLLALREYLLTVRSGGGLGWRVFATFSNPNLVAAYLALALPGAIALALRYARPRDTDSPLARPLAWLALLLILLGLPLTGSKGGALGTLAALVSLGLTLAPPGTAWSRRLRRGLPLALLAVVLLGLLLPPTRTRLAAAFSTQSNSTAFRLYTWDGMLAMLAARPLTGFGAGSFEWAYPGFAEAGFTRLGHQSFLQNGAELGLPGLLLFLALWVLLLVALSRRLRAEADLEGRLLPAVALAALWGFLVHNLVDYSWYSLAVGGTLLLLLGAALSRGGTALAAESPLGRRLVVAVLAVALYLVAVHLLGAQLLAAQVRRAGHAGDPASARSRAETATRLDPLDAELWVLRADLTAAADPAAAANLRMQAVSLRPSDSTNWRRIALLYQRAGDMDKALAAADQAVRQYPTYVLGWATLARLAETAGETSVTEGAWQQVSYLHDTPVGRYAALGDLTDPTYLHAWRYLLGLAEARGDAPLAEDYCRRMAGLLAKYYRLPPTQKYLLGTMMLTAPGDDALFDEMGDTVAGKLRATGRPEDARLAEELLAAREEARRQTPLSLPSP